MPVVNTFSVEKTTLKTTTFLPFFLLITLITRVLRTTAALLGFRPGSLTDRLRRPYPIPIDPQQLVLIPRLQPGLPYFLTTVVVSITQVYLTLESLASHNRPLPAHRLPVCIPRSFIPTTSMDHRNTKAKTDMKTKTITNTKTKTKTKAIGDTRTKMKTIEDTRTKMKTIMIGDTSAKMKMNTDTKTDTDTKKKKTKIKTAMNTNTSRPPSTFSHACILEASLIY
ncbi:hypothetical protein EDB85DRAFT_596499 [Lactarius pseudohatsudake]|nr:hypothetical protein EDB85DRAFT_596499 [Lactarius pseudohatsudake]